METLEERIERLEYYQSLVMGLVDDRLAPFYKMIIDAKLTKNDVEELLDLCEELSIKLKEQKAEGLVVFTPLLTHFVGMLHPHLNPEQTINVLMKQGIYTDLMQELKKMVANIQ